MHVLCVGSVWLIMHLCYVYLTVVSYSHTLTLSVASSWILKYLISFHVRVLEELSMTMHGMNLYLESV